MEIQPDHPIFGKPKEGMIRLPLKSTNGRANEQTWSGKCKQIERWILCQNEGRAIDIQQ